MSHRTFLLTWNILKWDWPEGYNTIVERIQKGEKILEPWTVSNTSIKVGDTVYLMKTGEDRGLVAKGTVSSEIYLLDHYEKAKAEQGIKTKHVDVMFYEALDFGIGQKIEWEFLKKRFPNQNWTPQSSGILVREEYVDELDSEWNSYLKTLKGTDTTNKDINTPLKPKDVHLIEGVTMLVCGNCGYEYIKAPRCPECGQLVKE